MCSPFEMNYGLLPPNLVRFFKPTEAFLEWLVGFVGDQFVIEVGAGMCEFTREMHKLGIKAMAIEPRPSDKVLKECSNFLFPTSVIRAVRILGEAKSIVIAARPDHSGWFQKLPGLIHPKSTLLYIGLESNLHIDIPDVDIELLFEGAGEEGENVYKVNYG